MKNMKKIKFIAMACLLMLLTLAILTNCKKETVQNTNIPNEKYKDKMIVSQIKNFKTKIKSDLKSNEEISIDSAIWYLEAALNFTYARANNTRDIINIDSVLVTVPTTQNNMILISDIALVYDILVDSLSVFYHSISGEKGLIFTDIATSELTNISVLLKMTSMITTGGGSGLFDFGPDDYWKWGFELGKCDGTMQPWDASSQLTSHANMDGCVLPISCYTSVEKTDRIYPYSVSTSSPNPFGYGDYLLFETSGLYPEVHQCLTPDALNYYLDALKTIATLYQPSNKNIIKYYCSWDAAYDPGYWVHVHFAQITYGVPILVSDPPEDL